jgi:hypothetical protein
VKAAVTATMLISGFFAALRGEEIIQADSGTIQKYWDEAVAWKGAQHVLLMLAGRFKRETGEKLFCQPLVAVTKSRVNIRLWFHRMIGNLERTGVTSGPVFRKVKGKRASTAELDVNFHGILMRVQN